MLLLLMMMMLWQNNLLSSQKFKTWLADSDGSWLDFCDSIILGRFTLYKSNNLSLKSQIKLKVTSLHLN